MPAATEMVYHGTFGSTFVITTAVAPALFGVVHLFIAAGDRGEIACGVAPQHRRQGLATRAVQLVTTWAFADLGLTRLEICITARGVHGLASQRVAEKAGFVYEGIRRSRLPMTGAEVEDRLSVLLAPPRRTEGFTSWYAEYPYGRPDDAFDNYGRRRDRVSDSV